METRLLLQRPDYLFIYSNVPLKSWKFPRLIHETDLFERWWIPAIYFFPIERVKGGIRAFDPQHSAVRSTAILTTGSETENQLITVTAAFHSFLCSMWTFFFRLTRTYVDVHSHLRTSRRPSAKKSTIVRERAFLEQEMIDFDLCVRYFTPGWD